jgi:hypothetical protein
MHVVDFSRNHGREAGTLHPVNEARPKKAPGRIEHPGCLAQTFPITVNVACGALNDLHAVDSDDIRQKRWRRGFTFGQKPMPKEAWVVATAGGMQLGRHVT